MKAIENAAGLLAARLKSDLAGTHSAVSVWEINEQCLSVVINTYGCVLLSQVSPSCWALGYSVEDVRFSHVGEADDTVTNVILSLKRL